MNFTMSIADNYASFIDTASGIAVFVDSFDNRKFDVRIGSVNDEICWAYFSETDHELNEKLAALFLAQTKI